MKFNLSTKVDVSELLQVLVQMAIVKFNSEFVISRSRVRIPFPALFKNKELALFFIPDYTLHDAVNMFLSHFKWVSRPCCNQAFP